jgi:hypothetical protein
MNRVRLLIFRLLLRHNRRSLPPPLAGEGWGGLMKTTLILGVLALFGF